MLNNESNSLICVYDYKQSYYYTYYILLFKRQIVDVGQKATINKFMLR